MSEVVPPKRPRRSRSVLGVLTAALVLAAATLGTIAALQVRAGHAATVLGNTHAVARWLREKSWDDDVVVVIGAALALVGLLLLLASVLPARHRLLAVHEAHPGVVSGITRRGLRADLAAVAEGVDGVASARARVRRRRVRLRVESKLRDRTGIEDAVVAVVAGELDRLRLERHRTVRARVNGPDPDPPPAGSRSATETDTDTDTDTPTDTETPTDIETPTDTDRPSGSVAGGEDAHAAPVDLVKPPDLFKEDGTEASEPGERS